MTEGKDVRYQEIGGSKKEKGGGRRMGIERGKFREVALGEFRGSGSDGADEEDVFVTGAATVVALLHFLKQGVPGGCGKDLGSLPLLGVFAFSLPGDFASK